MDSVKFSREAKALYVKFDKENRRIAETIPIGQDKFLDIDEKGNVLGIELLLPKNMPKEVYEAIIGTDSIEITS
ncbi:DUF2283 domain-containing protein [Candidatus Nitrosotenuis cloacae]|jgi:uncharacterized protein YuzE|uniref:DUF2283 domain-containing protein n=1 Tax=Candidatus Nitrosotenuis cloacae TaxID=1603555 RepID=UPI00228137F9|nr:DUF2283 domain-containing protein [Candidatus Nitrosotenuis cloacae]